MVRHFLMPCYERWIPEIKKSGCRIIDMDSDGDIGELIPLWIEAGINVCCPVEVAAGNDLVELRRRFGTQMAYTGGIDKRALAKGGAVMEAELKRVIPPLLEKGGYIPGCDHGVPPDISWPNFVAYARLLAQYPAQSVRLLRMRGRTRRAGRRASVCSARRSGLGGFPRPRAV